MKKRILLFIMVVVILVSAFVFATTASAACSSTKGKDIADKSTVISSSDDAKVRPELLIDGNTTNGTFYMHGTFTFVFPEVKQISDVRVYLNSNDSNATAYTATIEPDQSITYTPTNASGKFIASVKVEFIDANDQVVWTSGDVNTKDTNNRVDISSVDAYSVKKVSISITENGNVYGKAPLFEVKIYERSGTHNWKLDKTISTTEQPYQAADCVNNGKGTYKCECGATKYDVIYSTGHEFGSYTISPEDPTKHARICLRGSEGLCNEAPLTLFDISDHEYDNECDTTCNVCPATRTVEPHTYVSDCDEHCNKCDLKRTPVNGAQHKFAYSCTVECEDCKEPNPNWVDHTYTSDCDPDCNFCGLVRIVNPHVYNSKCDDVCNVPNCGYERNTISDPTLIPHTYTADCDTHCNNENCVYVRQPLMEHPFKNKCDKNCDKCNELNPDYIEGHLYDNDCDGECNECKQKRNVDDHRYDNVCDIDCNTCGAQRTVSKHIFGDWITLIPASKNADGMRAHYCVNCDKEETEVLPMIVENGLGTGAIVGIVVGCVVVVGGCTAIGLYSLVIKPKMEEKKRLEAEEAKRKAEEEDEEEYEDDEEYEDEESEEEEK